MAVEGRLPRTVSFMMVSGRNHTNMVSASISPKRPPAMKATGTWIRDMSLGLTSGPAVHPMKVSMSMDRIRAMVCIRLRMAMCGMEPARTA